MLPASWPLLVSCPSKNSGSETEVGWEHWPGVGSRESLASGRAPLLSMDTGNLDKLKFRIGASTGRIVDISTFTEQTLEWNGLCALQAMINPAPDAFRRTKMITVRPYRAIQNTLQRSVYLGTSSGEPLVLEPGSLAPLS